MTRVRFREAPRHHAVRREAPLPRYHAEAPAPPPPPPPNPSPRAITSLPLPPDSAPIAAAPVAAPQPVYVAAAVSPALKAESRIHPIILPQPVATPAVLVASGTVAPASADATPFVRVRLPFTRPPPPPPPPPAPLPSPAPAPAPNVHAAVAPVSPTAQPYILPGHALPLDEELKLVNDLNQSPWGMPTTHRHAIPRFFGWIGSQISRPFRALFHALQ